MRLQALAVWRAAVTWHGQESGPGMIGTKSCRNFGMDSARSVGEAKRTVLLDQAKTFYGFLGTTEFSIVGQAARLLSGYWLPMVFKSLWTYFPRNFLHALVDVRIGSFVWRGRTPGGLVLADTSGRVVLQHAESQPGDHVDFAALTSAVLALKR